MTRHHANNILLTRNLHLDSDVRQWSHPLTILLHCLWAKSNYRRRGQFECDVTLLFWFRSFTCTMRLLIRSLFTFSRCATNRLIAKWILKLWIIINKTHFVIFLDSCTHKNIKPQKSRLWGFSSTLTPTHFFAIRGRRKRGF